MESLWIKWIHILSATILFGTGVGIAFFKLWADRQNDIRAQLVVMRTVVLADWIFTAPSIMIQFATGVWLALVAGYSLNQGWLLSSIILFFFAGACWIPVVWLQIAMRNQIQAAIALGAVLPAEYHSYRKIWLALGVLAFSSLVVVFYLMVFKPSW